MLKKLLNPFTTTVVIANGSYLCWYMNEMRLFWLSKQLGREEPETDNAINGPLHLPLSLRPVRSVHMPVFICAGHRLLIIIGIWPWIEKRHLGDLSCLKLPALTVKKKLGILKSTCSYFNTRVGRGNDSLFDSRNYSASFMKWVRLMGFPFWALLHCPVQNQTNGLFMTWTNQALPLTPVCSQFDLGGMRVTDGQMRLSNGSLDRCLTEA